MEKALVSDVKMKHDTTFVEIQTKRRDKFWTTGKKRYRVKFPISLIWSSYSCGKSIFILVNQSGR
jgi:hypothetical protein